MDDRYSRDSENKPERNTAEANRLLFPDLSRDRPAADHFEVVIGRDIIVTRERSPLEMAQLLFPQQKVTEAPRAGVVGFVERRRVARH